MALTPKQQAFANEYLIDFNATRAAQRAGYSGDENTLAATGSRLIRIDKVDEAIRTRLSESAMRADEVLMRLAEHARGDMGAWLSNDGEIDIAAMKAANTTRLLRKVKRTYRSGETEAGGTWEETRLEVELHDAQAALVHIGKHHGLFKDVSESKIDVSADDETRSLLSRIDQLASRIRTGESAGGTGTDRPGEATS